MKKAERTLRLKKVRGQGGITFTVIMLIIGLMIQLPTKAQATKAITNSFVNISWSFSADSGYAQPVKTGKYTFQLTQDETIGTYTLTVEKGKKAVYTIKKMTGNFDRVDGGDSILVAKTDGKYLYYAHQGKEVRDKYDYTVRRNNIYRLDLSTGKKQFCVSAMNGYIIEVYRTYLYYHDGPGETQMYVKDFQTGKVRGFFAPFKLIIGKKRMIVLDTRGGTDPTGTKGYHLYIANFDGSQKILFGEGYYVESKGEYIYFLEGREESATSGDYKYGWDYVRVGRVDADGKNKKYITKYKRITDDYNVYINKVIAKK